VLAVALTGCGRDENRGAAAPPRPDPAAEYRAALGQQCVEARFDREAIDPPATGTAKALARYLGATLRVARTSERRAGRLRPPPALAVRHREARRLTREAIRLVSGAAAQARRRGAAPDRILRRLEPPLNARIEAGNRIAESIGLPQCAQGTLDLAFGD